MNRWEYTSVTVLGQEAVVDNPGFDAGMDAMLNDVQPFE